MLVLTLLPLSVLTPEPVWWTRKKLLIEQSKEPQLELNSAAAFASAVTLTPEERHAAAVFHSRRESSSLDSSSGESLSNNSWQPTSSSWTPPSHGGTHSLISSSSFQDSLESASSLDGSLWTAREPEELWQLVSSSHLSHTSWSWSGTWSTSWWSTSRTSSDTDTERTPKATPGLPRSTPSTTSWDGASSPSCSSSLPLPPLDPTSTATQRMMRSQPRRRKLSQRKLSE